VPAASGSAFSAYSPAGTAVEIGLQTNGGSATVTVRDQGPGIPASLLPRIFDPFFRVDPSRDEHTGGLGLGLAIARRAIRVHQGEISVENMTPGALFRISLPLRSEGAPNGKPHSRLPETREK
jgi:two-component system sensor histidine kinase CpxA